MTEFELRVHKPRLLSDISVAGVSGVAERGEQLRYVLVVLEYLLHLLSGVTAVSAELAAEGSTSRSTAAELIACQPCVAVLALFGEVAWSKRLNLVIGAIGKTSRVRVRSLALSGYGLEALGWVLHYLWAPVPVEDEYSTLSSLVIQRYVSGERRGCSFLGGRRRLVARKFSFGYRP